MQVHKEPISSIPNSTNGRGDTEVEIYGMEGIPEKDMEEKRQQIKRGKYHDSDSDSDGEESKKSKTEQPTAVPGMPTMGVPMMPMMGVPGMFPVMAPGMPPMMPGIMPGMMPGMTPGMPSFRMPPIPGMPAVGMPPTGGVLPTAATGTAMPRQHLFPAAAAAAQTPLTASANEPVGADFKPLSSSENQEKEPKQEAPPSKWVVPKANQIPLVSANSRIIHPEEDNSLEELKSSFERYKIKERQPVPQSSVTPATIPASMPHQPISSMGGMMPQVQGMPVMPPMSMNGTGVLPGMPLATRPGLQPGGMIPHPQHAQPQQAHAPIQRMLPPNVNAGNNPPAGMDMKPRPGIPLCGGVFPPRPPVPNMMNPNSNRGGPQPLMSIPGDNSPFPPSHRPQFNQGGGPPENGGMWNRPPQRPPMNNGRF